MRLKTAKGYVPCLPEHEGNMDKNLTGETISRNELLRRLKAGKQLSKLNKSKKAA